MKTQSAKAKGRRAAQNLRLKLLLKFPELEPDDIRVTPSGVNGPDLQLSPKAQKLFPFNIEVKNQERLNIWAALKQCLNHGAKAPLVAFTRNRDDMYVAIRLNDFLNVV